MNRINCVTRENWKKKVEEIGFGFHTIDGLYWDESAFYEFTMPQIDVLEKATEELNNRCLEAVEFVIEKKLYQFFQLNPRFIPLIEQSWHEDAPSIYGRFDLVYDGVNPPKMLEYNADTPTSLFEAGVVQWHWLEDIKPGADQFNSIHEKLIGYWKHLKAYLKPGPLYFACLQDNIEDLTTVEYLRDCAIQAGLNTEFIYVEDLGWNSLTNTFVDLNDSPIHNIFKLYPWEWMAREEFGQNLMNTRNTMHWIEPAWKMLLSNKAIMPFLWRLFPDHPNLLPTYFESEKVKYSYVKKPLLSREGENISIVRNGNLLLGTQGSYGAEGYIYQQFCELPSFRGNYPVIGSWVIGGEPAGIGIRESKTLITDNLSSFVPHVIG